MIQVTDEIGRAYTFEYDNDPASETYGLLTSSLQSRSGRCYPPPG
jgi:hypothetical protein